MVLTDADRIRNLLGRYCRLVDAADFTGVGALMSRATYCTHDGTVLATGADEIARFVESVVQVHDDATLRTQHLVLNTVFDEPATDGTVVARSSYVVLQATDTLALQPIITGSYVDTFACDGQGADSGWHFTERRFGLGLTGDLSHHMAPGFL